MSPSTPDLHPLLLPMDATQQAIWYEEELRADGSNTGCFSVTLTGPVDPDDIAAACAAVVARHPPLRSLVTLARDRPELAVRPPGALPLPYAVLPHPCAPGGEAAATLAWWQEHGKRSFDLTAEPPLWFRLLRHGPQRHTLLVVVHHLCFDGRSKFVFARDFTTALDAVRRGEADPAAALGTPPEAGTPAGDAVPDEPLAESAAYWNAVCPAGLPPLALPTEGAAPGPELLRPPAFTLDHSARDRLAAVAAEAGTTLFGGLLAVLARRLRAYGNETLVLSIPCDTSTPADRDEIGVAVNAVPLLLHVGAHDSFRTVLDGVRAELARLRRCRRVPFRELTAGTSWARPGAATPFTGASVTFLRLPPALPELAGVRTDWEFVTPNTSRSFDLMFQLRDTGTGVHGRVECVPEAIDPRGAAELTAGFPEVVRRALAAPGAAWIPEAPVTAAPAARCPAPAGAEHRDLGGLFAHRATTHPDRPAAVDADRSVSYRELDRIAAAAAWTLTVAGAGPGTTVTLPPAATVEGLGTLLGALRTGAHLAFSAAAEGPGAPPTVTPAASPAPPAASVWTRCGCVLDHQAEGLGLRDRPVRTPLLAEPGGFAFVQELFLTWSLGGAVQLAGGPARDAAAVHAAVRDATRGGAECLLLTTHRLLRELVRLPGGLPGPVHALVPVGGVRPDAEVSAALRAGLRVHTQYVHPEAGPVATQPLTAPECTGPPRLTGLVPGLRAAVQDPAGVALPPGVAGELVLWPPHPTGPAAEPLRTGDRAVLGRDTVLRYLGPAADTVYWAGQTLDTAAVARRLHTHPDVLDAVVLVEEGHAVAHVRPRAGAAPRVAELRRAVRDGAAHRELRLARVVLCETLPAHPEAR